MPVVYTIGHSNHSLEKFLELAAGAQVTAIADVRSAPYSRRHPQFNREPLRDALKAKGLSYVYLGDALGGHPKDPALWRGPRPDYERMAATAMFCEGLGRIEKGLSEHAIAIMCAEREPLDCHRCVLVARALKARGLEVRHILADGAQEDHVATERRLLDWAGFGGADLFEGAEARLADAYRKRGAWMWGEKN